MTYFVCISTAFQNTVVIAPFVFGVASVKAIIYCWATPVFIDSNRETWNMNSELLAEELDSCARKGKLPMAAMVVD